LGGSGEEGRRVHQHHILYARTLIETYLCTFWVFALDISGLCGEQCGRGPGHPRLYKRGERLPPPSAVACVLSKHLMLNAPNDRSMAHLVGFFKFVFSRSNLLSNRLSPRYCERNASNESPPHQRLCRMFANLVSQVHNSMGYMLKLVLCESARIWL
jgi:hypothetical protein